jgi:hypothetical protein
MSKACLCMGLEQVLQSEIERLRESHMKRDSVIQELQVAHTHTHARAHARTYTHAHRTLTHPSCRSAGTEQSLATSRAQWCSPPC